MSTEEVSTDAPARGSSERISLVRLAVDGRDEGQMTGTDTIAASPEYLKLYAAMRLSNANPHDPTTYGRCMNAGEPLSLPAPTVLMAGADDVAKVFVKVKDPTTVRATLDHVQQRVGGWGTESLTAFVEALSPAIVRNMSPAIQVLRRIAVALQGLAVQTPEEDPQTSLLTTLDKLRNLALLFAENGSTLDTECESFPAISSAQFEGLLGVAMETFESIWTRTHGIGDLQCLHEAFTAFLTHVILALHSQIRVARERQVAGQGEVTVRLRVMTDGAEDDVTAAARLERDAAGGG